MNLEDKGNSNGQNKSNGHQSNSLNYYQLYSNRLLFHSDHDSWHSDSQFSHNSVQASICEESIQERYLFIKEQYKDKISFEHNQNEVSTIQISCEIRNENTFKQSLPIEKKNQPNFQQKEQVNQSKQESSVQQKIAAQMKDDDNQQKVQNHEQNEIEQNNDIGNVNASGNSNEENSQNNADMLGNIENASILNNNQNSQNILSQMQNEGQGEQQEYSAYEPHSEQNRSNDEIFYSDSESGRNN